MTQEIVRNPDGEKPEENIMSGIEQNPKQSQGEIPHSGKYGVEKPVEEFDTPLHEAVKQGKLSELPEAMDPRKKFGYDERKKRKLKRNLIIASAVLATTGVASVIGVGVATKSAENNTEPQNDPGVSAPQNPGESASTTTQEVQPSYEGYNIPFFYEESDEEYNSIEQAATEIRLSVADANTFESGDTAAINDIVSDAAAQKIQVALSLIKQAQIRGDTADVDFLTNGDEQVYKNLEDALTYFGDDPDAGTDDYVPTYNICRTTTEYTDDQNSCIEGAATTDYNNEAGSVFTIQRITPDDLTGFSSENAERWNANFKPTVIEGTRLILQHTEQ